MLKMSTSTHWNFRVKSTCALAYKDLSDRVDISLLTILRQMEDSINKDRILGLEMSSMITKFVEELERDWSELNVIAEEEELERLMDIERFWDRVFWH